jgi:hypothetical protein
MRWGVGSTLISYYKNIKEGYLLGVALSWGLIEAMVGTTTIRVYFMAEMP